MSQYQIDDDLVRDVPVILPCLVDFLTYGRALRDLLGEEVANRDDVRVVLAMELLKMLLQHQTNVVVVCSALHARWGYHDDSLHC